MKTTKRSALLSVMALFLCLTMLLGTTWAWFTDSVTSSGNKIQAGTLKLDLEMLNKETGAYESIKTSKDPIFNYNLWEPGYTDVKFLKVENEGSLSLKWKAMFVSDEEVSKLAEVIDVYVLPSVTELGYDNLTRDFDGWRRVGTLDQFINTLSETTYGNLLPYSCAYLGIALHMQEEAGNEYQEIGLEAFDIQIVATQMSNEEDSFGPDYDNDAEWGDNLDNENTASAPIVLNENGELTENVTLTGENGITATIPAGTKFKAGTKNANLNVNKLVNSGANITLADNEESKSYDVHIENMANDNESVISIVIAEFLPIGLNMGNYKLYHVENGNTVEMTLVASGSTPIHNTYEYDPATGDVVLHLASFSEVALVADTENAWEGKYDYSWYSASKTELTIANADQLAAFGAIVGGMNEKTRDSFAEKTVKLVSNINIGDLDSENGIVFYPIGYYNNTGSYTKEAGKIGPDGSAVVSGFKTFEGTFDGNGNIISNFYQNTWEMFGDYNDGYSGTPNHYRDGMGLFGKVYGGTVKNLTVYNFSSDGEYTTTGCIAAYADCGATFENIAIVQCNPRVYNIGNGGIVGCVGWYANDPHNEAVTFKNITVDNTNKISALWGSWDVACGGLVGQYYPTSGQSNAIDNAGIKMTNCHVAAQIDVYNDVCANYQYYAYRYAGILIGSVRENIEVDGHVYPNMDGIVAENCTVHFGDWNDYYYCELVANSLASYTHDHQMSRLVQVAKVDVENMKVTDLQGKTTDIPKSGRYNYVVVNGEHATENATCYHFVDGEVWDHKDAGTETVNGETVLKEDKQHIYREFNNLVTGYGWGVTSKGVDDMNGVDILDRLVGDSVDKFTGKAPENVITGSTFKLGDLFSYANNGVAINSQSVIVTVKNLDENGTVKATITPNANDWTTTTIKFTGSGEISITIQDYYYCNPTTITLKVDDLYLVGYINGNDYGCNDDAANMGKYKFDENGKLTVSFEKDSYVFLKTTGNSNWYGTKSLVLTKEAIFYNHNTGSNYQKMLVPAGYEITFTVKVNSDGTLSLDATYGASIMLLIPNSNWKVDNARFAAYVWNDEGNAWFSMLLLEGSTYYCWIPSSYNKIIFCRMTPSNTTNNWNNKWNQTSDLAIPTTGNNCFAVKEGTWDKGGGTWSKK